MPGPYLVSLSTLSSKALEISGWWNNGSSIKLVNVQTSKPARKIATWAYTNSYAIPTNGSISATVLENTTPIPFCTVLLYYRPNGFLIASKKTDVAGNVVFEDLDPTNPENYFMVALDPAGGISYNAIVFDRLTAV